ncbi:MAG: hypothetical protein IJ746_04820 [Ruminococcus sp.]|nr:hypothetical protein [Ruminococcus sp.]
MEVMKGIRNLEKGEYFSTWLHKIALRKANDHKEKAGRRQRVIFEEDEETGLGGSDAAVEQAFEANYGDLIEFFNDSRNLQPYCCGVSSYGGIRSINNTKWLNGLPLNNDNQSTLDGTTSPGVLLSSCERIGDYKYKLKLTNYMYQDFLFDGVVTLDPVTYNILTYSVS